MVLLSEEENPGEKAVRGKGVLDISSGREKYVCVYICVCVESGREKRCGRNLLGPGGLL